MDRAELREEIIGLGPWHFDIELDDGLSTAVSLETPAETYPDRFGPVSFQDVRAEHRAHMRALYPGPGRLDGRTVLDCACNSGGYLFWSRELRAGRCFGFDAREHWIRQARFIKQHRPDTDAIEFEVMDLYDVPDRGLEPFDLTLFKGIFYHLPDPVTGLKIAADLTKEALILDTNSRAGLPDGMLSLEGEGAEELMLGIHGLNWHPTGPETVIRILEWAGFVEFHVMRWVREYKPGTGRFGMVASKKAGLLDHWKSKQVDARDRPPE